MSSNIKTSENDIENKTEGRGSKVQRCNNNELRNRDWLINTRVSLRVRNPYQYSDVTESIQLKENCTTCDEVINFKTMTLFKFYSIY